MSRQKNRTIIVAIVILLIVSISIGYARISTTLQINGTAGISKNEWHVHWANLEVKEGAGFATTGDGVSGQAHILSTDDTKIEFDVALPLPGDVYAFEVDMVNDGTIPAELVDIKITINDQVVSYADFDPVTGTVSALPRPIKPEESPDLQLNDLFIFGFTYIDGSFLKARTSGDSGVVQGDILAAKNDTNSDTRRVKVWTKYNDDIIGQDLNSEPLPAHVVVELLYVQQGK